MLLHPGYGLSPANQGAAPSAVPFDFATDFPDLWMGIEADNPANITETVAQNFDPGDINLSTHVIDFGVDMDFSAAPSSINSARATRGWFTTTGTLPPEIEAHKFYYLSLVSGTTYRVFPEVWPDDWDKVKGMVPEQMPLEAQAFWSGDNSIEFSGQGTGVHTFHTAELSTKLVDVIDGVYEIGPVASGRHAAFEIETDSLGKKYIRQRPIVFDTYDEGQYFHYGKVYGIGPSGQNLNIKTESANKRTVFQTHVCAIRDFVNYINNNRAPIDDVTTDINTTTDVVTYTAHTINTGDKVRVFAMPGSTLPGGLVAHEDMYARDLSANTFAFYPTQADAVADTNRIDLTSTGSGGMMVYCPARTADSGRFFFFVELIEPGSGGGNTLSPRVTQSAAPVNCVPADINTNGVWGRAGVGCKDWVTYNDADADGVVAMHVWVPSQDDGPICSDTGEVLRSGLYYVTAQPSSSVGARLHRTYADALASVGITVSSLTNTQVVKFTTVVTGIDYRVNFTVADGKIAQSFGSGDAADRPRFDLNKVHAWTFVIDGNDPAASFKKFYIYRDDELIEDFETAIAKGDTGSATTGSPGTYLNSAGTHVPGTFDMYASYFGSSTGAFDEAGFAKLITYIDGKYTLGRYLPERPRCVTKPRIYNTTGAEYAVIPGRYAGYPDATLTYQWYLDGVEEVGATSTTHTFSGSGTPTVVETATNSEGFITATSMTVEAIP